MATSATFGDALQANIHEAFRAPEKKPAIQLPAIREELRLIPAANNADGSPAWMIQDPISNKFYRIGWLDFELLVRWQMADVDAMIADINSTTTLDVDENHVLGLAGFLQQNNLVQAGTPQAVNALIQATKQRQKGVFNWLLHHYLFFRIPLIKPQVLLAKLLPILRWIFSPYTAFVVLMITLAGLFLVARQWDTFRSTFIDQLSLEGLFSYSVALLFSKCLHEFGHALTATRYGVRVGHMGIAMLVMLPLPYTDTSESWKLSNPKQRLHIASAGIVTELALAGIATLCWSLAPDGALKSALFFLATTSWVLTLAINVSPFMRFDGYFIVSDLLDFPNLHERSGALAKTWMRRTFLGFDEPWTEDFPAPKKRALIAFASFTWLYRITVFLGIAWLVYYFFFKVLGIILFVVEILWFVVLPIWRELKIWGERRSEIKASRIFFGLILIGGLIALGMLPWQTSVKGSGWIHATQQSTIFTPTAGKLVAFHAKGAVKAGESLFELTSPDIAIEALRAQGMAEARALEMRGLTGQEDGEAKRANLQFQQEKSFAEVKLYKDELDRMDLAAPFAGELQDIDDNLSVGTWVQPKQPLAVLINPQSWAVDVMVPEAEISRIRVGDAAQIYPKQSRFERLAGIVQAIDSAKVNALPHPLLDAQHGGEIATLQGDKSIPTQGFFKVRVVFSHQPKLEKMALADVKIETQAKAWLPTFFERIAALFVRESGF